MFADTTKERNSTTNFLHPSYYTPPKSLGQFKSYKLTNAVMASKRPATSKAKKQGEFLDKWVRYETLLHEVRQHDTVETLKKQMFRFALFFPLVMANVLVNSAISSEYDISNALTETIVNQPFLRPAIGTVPAGVSSGYMNFDQISSHSEFWAVSRILLPFPSL